MNTHRTARNTAAVIVAIVVAACGGSADGDAERTSSSPATSSTDDPVPTVPETTSTTVDLAPPTGETTSETTTAPVVTEPTEPPTSANDLSALQAQVDELCDVGRYAGLPSAGGTAESVAEVLAFLQTASETVSTLESLDVPPELRAGFDVVLDAASSADAALDAAERAAAENDVALAERLIDQHIAHLWSINGRLALAGLACTTSDPARASAADLNVPLDLHAEQLNVGFGSVWVSQKYGDTVARVDPATGAVIATIEVGTDPLKLQPAGERMWVRTADAYVAIDASSNAVVAELVKADVGPEANRNFAFEDAMWICDGDRLHRYDLATLTPVATIDLTARCDFVYAIEGLVLAWNTDDDPGESGASAAVVVDPVSNAVVTTIELPADVVWPAVLDDVVFFGGQYNRTAVVIDRASWTVRTTVDLPDVVGGGGITTDGTSIFVPTRGDRPWDVLVVDAESFEVVDTLRPLDVNGIATDEEGAVWVVGPDSNVLQRFDIEP